MTNLFAFRTKDPKLMKLAPEPVGPENDKYLLACRRGAALIVAAWGNDGVHLNRAAAVCAFLGPLHHLRMTRLGQPWHPRSLPEVIHPVPLPDSTA